MIALVFTMTILDVNNPPYFDDIRDFNLLEKSPPGTLLDVITAKDPDTLPGYNTLTYTIGIIFNGTSKYFTELIYMHLKIRTFHIKVKSINLKITSKKRFALVCSFCQNIVEL